MPADLLCTQCLCKIGCIYEIIAHSSVFSCSFRYVPPSKHLKIFSNHFNSSNPATLLCVFVCVAGVGCFFFEIKQWTLAFSHFFTVFFSVSWESDKSNVDQSLFLFKNKFCDTKLEHEITFQPKKSDD